MIQQLIVGAVVIAAFVASVWKLMPARRRLRVLSALDFWAARHPSLARWRERRLAKREPLPELPLPGIPAAADAG